MYNHISKWGKIVPSLGVGLNIIIRQIGAKKPFGFFKNRTCIPPKQEAVWKFWLDKLPENLPPDILRGDKFKTIGAMYMKGPKVTRRLQKSRCRTHDTDFRLW